MLQTKKIQISYHEAGHAVMALLNDCKVKLVSLNGISSVLGTDDYLGFTELESFESSSDYTINEANRKLMISLGGYASEILFFDGKVNIGGDDLTNAISLVEAMLYSEDFCEMVSRLPVPGPGPLDMINRADVKAVIDYSIHVCVEVLVPYKQLIEIISQDLRNKGELSGEEINRHLETFINKK